MLTEGLVRRRERQGLPVVIPSFSEFTDILAEPVFYRLIISFQLTIGAWAVGSCRHQLRSRRDTYGVENFLDKLQSIIGQNTVGNATPHDPCVHKGTFNVDCCCRSSRSRLCWLWVPAN